MKQRTLTAAILIPLVLAALFASATWPIGILAVVAYVVGIRESARLVKGPAPAIAVDVAGGALIAALVLLWFPTDRHSIRGAPEVFLLGWSLFGVLSTWLCVRPNGISLFRVFAGAWLSGPLAALIQLHENHSPQPWLFATPVLLAIVPLWGGDTAAYFVGKAFGKNKLAPSISPGKTWEGGAANLLVCVAVAIPLALWLGRAWPIGLACGLASGVFGQAGDLFESYVKRQAGVKDSGALLPGHGGLLDRIDSILFTAPVVAFILLWS